jgi:hypothetical protein
VRSVNAEIGPHLGTVRSGGTRDTEAASDFHGAQTKRMNRLPVRSRTLREEVLNIDLLHDLCDAAFSTLHRDLENHPPFVTMGKSAPEVTLDLLLALSNFTEENGGTRITPGSHKWHDFQDRGTQEMTVAVEMKAGDALLFSGKVAYGGGANHTTDEYRRAIAPPLQPSFLTAEEPYPFLLEIDHVRGLPHRVQSVLGFRSQHARGAPGGVWFIDSGGELGNYLGL